MKDHKKLVCFDFDGTLTPTNSLHHLCIIMFFYRRSLWRYVWLIQFILFIPLFLVAYHIKPHWFNRLLYARFSGMDVNRVNQVIERYLVPYLYKRIYPQAESTIQSYRERGYELIVVSASWENVVKPVAHMLGIQHCIASRVEINNGRIGKRLQLLVDEEVKAKQVRYFVHDHELDQHSIVAYGNSSLDIPMLMYAAKRHVINPGKSLTNWAKRHHAETIYWGMPAFPWHAYMMYLIAIPMFASLKGVEHIPRRGGCLVIANHSSYLDNFILYTVITTYLGRCARFVAKQEHFRTPLHRLFLQITGTFPINRQRGGRMALARAIDLIKQGEVVVIYPEGTRSRDGRLGDFKAGVLYIQEKTSCPIIPGGIRGTYDILPAHKTLPRPGKVTLQFGKPLQEIEGMKEIDSVLQAREYKIGVLRNQVEKLLSGTRETMS